MTEKEIYIPLCLYLYITNNAYASLLERFTFHYVYIYMLSGTEMAVSCTEIYIPLCLYLYTST